MRFFRGVSIADAMLYRCHIPVPGVATGAACKLQRAALKAGVKEAV